MVNKLKTIRFVKILRYELFSQKKKSSPHQALLKVPSIFHIQLSLKMEEKKIKILNVYRTMI